MPILLDRLALPQAAMLAVACFSPALVSMIRVSGKGIVIRAGTHRHICMPLSTYGRIPPFRARGQSLILAPQEKHAMLATLQTLQSRAVLGLA